MRQCPWRKLIWILCKPQKRRISFGQKICVTKDHSRSELSKFLLLIHPGKLTWNPKMVVISRFHVNFQGCTPTLHTSPPASSPNLLHLSLISKPPPLVDGEVFPHLKRFGHSFSHIILFFQGTWRKPWTSRSGVPSLNPKGWLIDTRRNGTIWHPNWKVQVC